MAFNKTIALILILLSGWLRSDFPAQPDPNVWITAQATEQVAMAEWALERYAMAGLRLPDLAIEFPGSDQAYCDGAPARTYLNHTPVTVRMCWDDSFMILHELAHVWEAQNATDQNRDEFMAQRTGVRSWASPDHSWDEQGREHAANVVAWGLLEDPYPVSRTYPNDPDNMLKAFYLLTGTDTLHDGGPGIQVPDRTLTAGRSNPRLESGR